MDTTDTGSARRLAITVYENSTNTRGRTATADFTALGKLFSARQYRANKDGKAFSPYRLKTGTTRANANVEALSMAVADIDDGAPLDALRAAIAPYTWIATSSHSHSKDHPKYRIVFPLSRDVLPAEWPAFRTAFHALLGGHCDPATKDLARFYYLPSCPESERGNAFYESNTGVWMDPDTLAPAPLLQAAPVAKAVFENEFAGGPTEFTPVSLVIVAQHCAQVRQFQDTGCSGTDMEPLWWANLGVAKHCEDGEALAHEWSQQYAGYSHSETQAKLDAWAYGPTTCDKFKDLNPLGCKGCKAKCKSPITLGHTLNETPPTIVEVTPDGEEVQFIPPFWPRGFFELHGAVQMQLDSKDTGLTNVKVFSPLFYLTDRIRGDDGTFVFRARMNVRGNQWREFEIPAKQVTEIRTLKATLASYEIIVHNDKLMESFITQYATKLRLNIDEVHTFKQFGWNISRTGFVIGDTMHTKDGRKPVRLSPDTIKDPGLISCGREVKGTKEEWTKGVTKLYDRPGGLPYQYTILTQFAAPLAPLLGYEEWNGIPLALTSEDSGYGKTTVAQIGINALYQCSKTMVSNTTVNAIVARASVMNNAPVLFDELTKQLPDPEDLAGVAYNLAHGRGKGGLQPNGKERDPVPPFKLMSTMTANKNFFDKLAQSKTTPIATQMRIFEIAMESYDKMDSVKDTSNLHAEHHELALHLVNNVYGVWADDYLGYIHANRPIVEQRLHSTAMSIVTVLGGHAARERFYAYHIACVLVAGAICKKIGAVEFDLQAIKKWAFRHIGHLRKVANKFGANTEDMFAQYLADLQGHILVTRHFDLLDARRGAIEVPMLPLRGAVAARLVLGSEKEAPKLYVAAKSLDDWCAKHDTTPSAFRRQLCSAGLLVGGPGAGQPLDRKLSLSRGVPSHPMGQCRCMEVVYAKAQGFIDEHVPITKGE